MTKITVSEDCGNSPKNILLQELTIAFAKRDAKSILQSATDEIKWRIVGDRLIEGKEDLAAALNGMEEIAELAVDHVVTHGKAGAVNGTRITADGKTLSICDVFVFSNSKGTTVKEITSYVIEID